MKCKRCGRRLTDPESIKRGYGNVCWEKIHEKHGISVRRASRFLVTPIENGYVGERNPSSFPYVVSVRKGVQHVLVNRLDPKLKLGWGSTSKASIDLAYAVLTDALGPLFASVLSDAFADEVISKLPKGRFDLSMESVMQWASKRK